MNELDPRARQIIDQALSADGPSGEERERVRSRLAARLGAAALATGAAGASSAAVTGSAAAAGSAVATAPTPPTAAAAAAAGATTGAAASMGGSAAIAATGGAAAVGASAAVTTGTAASAGLVTKAVLAVAVAGAIGVGAANTAWREPAAPSEERASIPARATTGREAPAASAEPAETGGVERSPVGSGNETPVTNTVTKPRAKATKVRTSSNTKSKKAPDRLDEELGFLRRAQEALQQGEPVEALRALDRHARLFPRGAMRQEREAARAVSLCELGRFKEGRAIARSLLARSPRTPLAARLARSCRLEAPSK